MKLNRDFFLGALVALVFSVPLTIGLAVAYAKDGASIQADPPSNVSSQMRDHWQQMLNNRQNMLQQRQAQEQQLRDLIAEVQDAKSDSTKTSAIADLAIGLAQQSLNGDPDMMSGNGELMYQMALMGRMQGWMSDSMFRNSMMAINGGIMHKMNSGPVGGVQNGMGGGMGNGMQRNPR